MANCSRAIFRAWSSSWCTFRYTRRCLLFQFAGYWLHSERRLIINFQVRNAHSIAEHWSGPMENCHENRTWQSRRQTKRVALVALWGKLNFLCTQGSRVESLLKRLFLCEKNWFACCSTQWPTDKPRVWHSRMNSPARLEQSVDLLGRHPRQINFLQFSDVYTPAKQLSHTTPDPWLNHKPLDLPLTND